MNIGGRIGTTSARDTIVFTFTAVSQPQLEPASVEIAWFMLALGKG
jgi:hypothetical protein